MSTMKVKQTFVFNEISHMWRCHFVNGINTDNTFYLEELFPAVYSAMIDMCCDSVFIKFKDVQTLSAYYDKHGNIIVRSICFT